MRRLSNFITGAFLGALVGAVAALLLAPASGEDLQSRAREKLASLRDEVQNAYSSRKSQLEAELESLRQPGRTED
ncbi:MAG: YtxH domain-containing protein [Anaerolineales bacterium]